MSALIAVGDYAWINPERIDAVVTAANSAIILFRSGEKVTVPGTADEVMDALAEGLKAVRCEP